MATEKPALAPSKRAAEFLARSFEASGRPDIAADVRRGPTPGHGTPLWMDEALRAIDDALAERDLTAEKVDREARELLRQAMNLLGNMDQHDPLERVPGRKASYWKTMQVESDRLWQLYRALLLPTPTHQEGRQSDEREGIAREIDPDAWQPDNFWEFREKRRKNARAAADRVLALRHPEPAAEGE